MPKTSMLNQSFRAPDHLRIGRSFYGSVRQIVSNELGKIHMCMRVAMGMVERASFFSQNLGHPKSPRDMGGGALRHCWQTHRGVASSVLAKKKVAYDLRWCSDDLTRKPCTANFHEFAELSRFFCFFFLRRPGQHTAHDIK